MKYLDARHENHKNLKREIDSLEFYKRLDLFLIFLQSLNGGMCLIGILEDLVGFIPVFPRLLQAKNMLMQD
jgi:hypothetical protein